MVFGAVGTLQGKLSPLSCKIVIEACMYLSVSIELADPLLELLEYFQAELIRRALKLSRFHNKLSWSQMAYNAGKDIISEAILSYKFA